MRKVVMLNRVSIDGFYAGPNGEIDWFIHDPEVDQAAHEMMQPDNDHHRPRSIIHRQS